MKLDDATVQVVLDGVALIAKVVGGKIGEGATEVVTVVKAIVDAIIASVDGHVDPAKVREEFATLAVKLAKNDAEADASLLTRFPTSG